MLSTQLRSIGMILALLLSSGCFHEQGRPEQSAHKIGLVFGFDDAHLGENHLRLGVFDVVDNKIVPINDASLRVTVVLTSPSGASGEPLAARAEPDGTAVSDGAGARFNYYIAAQLTERGQWHADVSMNTPWSPRPTPMPYAFVVR
jgi:hypothetical protein